MSKVEGLTTSYAEFFTGCGYLILCPYLETYRIFAGDDHKDFILGVGACLFLSTIVPILPEVASCTFAVASFLVAVSLAIGIFAFPLAFLADLIEDKPKPFQSPIYDF